MKSSLHKLKAYLIKNKNKEIIIGLWKCLGLIRDIILKIVKKFAVYVHNSEVAHIDTANGFGINSLAMRKIGQF